MKADMTIQRKHPQGEAGLDDSQLGTGYASEYSTLPGDGAIAQILKASKVSLAGIGRRTVVVLVCVLVAWLVLWLAHLASPCHSCGLVAGALSSAGHGIPGPDVFAS
jgi:hypothetical protein